ncbi:MAG: N-acetyltransferase [Actinomycetia bacterium]|nr:N-acetyltransferase [Actinomycetes bacterium]
MLSQFTLEGHGVRLEPLALDHLESLAKAAAGDRDSYGYTWVPDGLADARAYAEQALVARDSGHQVPFAVRELGSGQLAGATRFLDLDVFTWPSPWPPGIAPDPVPSDEQPPTVAEIGSTWYAPWAQRTHVNTACKLLLLRHAFEEWRSERVTLKTDARNARSRAAIERIGGHFEGIRRVHVPATDGTFRDSAYFSIIAAEWPTVRERLEQRLTRPR